MLDKLEFVIWALKMIQSWPKYHRKTLLKKRTSLYLKNGPFINFITQIFTSRPDSKSKLDYEGKLKAVTCPDMIITISPKTVLSGHLCIQILDHIRILEVQDLFSVL